MSEEKSRFKTIIDGKEYTIVGSKSQTHMKTVSEIVSEQLETLKSMTNGLDKETRAVLLAINTVSDQIELQKKIARLEEKNKELMEIQENKESE